MDVKAGYFFISNSLALDFINTRPVLEERPKEFLNSFESLMRWYVAAGLLVAEAGAKFHRRWRDTPQAVAALEEALAVRERLREEIIHVEAHKGIRPKMITELNHLLQKHVLPLQIVPLTEGFAEEFRFAPGEPTDLLAPLVYAAADLFTKFDLRRIRKCQACVLHFYDTTKNATRRWCSMKICGNRAKVASYVARQRQAAAPRRIKNGDPDSAKSL